MHNDSLLPFLEAARAEAARRWPNTGPAPTTAPLALAWHDSGMASGFVLGAQWARSNAVVTALRQAADHLRAEERHWWADTIMAAIETLASEGSAVDAIERVRALHASGDEWCGYHNSALCECANVYCEECGADWPCPTVQALDGGGSDE